MNSTERFAASSADGSQSNDTNNSTVDADVYILAGDIYFYALAVVFPPGIVGNLLSACVFIASPTLRRSTTALLLVALGVADNTLLSVHVIRWLAFRRHHVRRHAYLPEWMGLGLYDRSESACKGVSVLRFASEFWSSWLTVAVSVERLLVVSRPFDVSRILTRRRTAVVIVVILFVGFCLSLFPLWTISLHHENGNPSCKRIEESSNFVWTLVCGYVMTLVLPGAVLVVLTGAIICFVYRARSVRVSHLGTTSSHPLHGTTASASASASPRHLRGVSGVSVHEGQMTMTLVSICVVSICLRTPYAIAYYMRSIEWELREQRQEPEDPHWSSAHGYLFMFVSEVLSILNSAVNLLLYCLCGRSFRQEARRLLCGGCSRQDEDSSREVARLRRIKLNSTPQQF